MYNLALLAKMTAGGLVGAIVGSNLAPRLPQKTLRLALSAFLLLIGVVFCYRAASL
jgi:uncharacterized membrane protein YfcA